MKMIWTCEGKPRAIVQIMHGMAEHKHLVTRYAYFESVLRYLSGAF